MVRLHVAIAVVGGTTGGPATYGIRLVHHLAAWAERSGALELSVLTDHPDACHAPAVRVVPLPMRRGLDRLRWQYWALPRALRRLRPDVYHDTKNALPFGLPCPAVVTVHDLAYHTVPATFPTASRWFLRLATADAVRRARVVVVPSAATAADLRRIHPGAAARVLVVPHGIDPAPTVSAAERTEVLRRLGVPEPYVLHLGTIQARKNVDLVIQGVRELRRRGLPHRALVVGRLGWRAGRATAELTADDTARWLPHVAAADLPAVYAGAAAFVSPSAYEGFGLAVADALAAGVPTVIADISSLPELCGTAAVRLTELSGAAVAAALEPLLRDPATGLALGAAGRARAAQFRWSDAAAGHLQAYRRAAGHLD
ncbi:MAG: glycosyltransferase family 4 protein [Planctomycetes bacterium]|nr:glycosyltransferase family 4 protein [Planctomycetota bacterium]